MAQTAGDLSKGEGVRSHVVWEHRWGTSVNTKRASQGRWERVTAPTDPLVTLTGLQPTRALLESPVSPCELADFLTIT